MIRGKACKPFFVGTALYSGSGITCMSEKLVRQLETHFAGEDLVYTFPGLLSITMAGNRKTPREQQMRRLCLSIPRKASGHCHCVCYGPESR